MPEIKVTRRGERDSFEVDDVIVSPDMNRVKMIKAHSHEVIDEPTENFRKMEYYKSDSEAWKFTTDRSSQGKEYEQPFGWKKLKDIDRK